MKNFYEINLKSGAHSSLPIAQIDAALRSKTSYVWLDIDHTASRPEAQKLLGKVFGFHAWTIKQSFSSGTRPKLEEHENYLFVVVPSLAKTGSGGVEVTNLSIFLGTNFVVSVHTKPIQAVTDVLKELPKQDQMLHQASDQLLYRLLDEVVDDYRPIIDKLDDEVESVEGAVVNNPVSQTQAKIFRIKKNVLGLKRSVGPLREVLNSLTSRQLPFVTARMRLMFRGTYDHTLRTNDELESFRELMSSAMDSYISQMSNRLNEIMKILSIVATVMLPLTLITGIWGTNFRNLPGLTNPAGFWIMIISMLALTFLMIWFFRWRKWF
ncbi:magnesium/cobalt transporter CorA [Patescibacteria group bacterium]